MRCCRLEKTIMLRAKVFLIIFIFSPFLARSAIPILTVDDTSNPDQGIVKLYWEHPTSDILEFELQQSTSSDFETFTSVYKGSDPATFISGLEDGTYYYRVYHSPTLSYSDTINIEVKHHPLGLALIMLSIGAVVFILTLFVLLKGARQKNIA